MLTTPKFAYPMGTDKFFLTGQPLQGVNPPTPKNHARPPLRADVPCETQQPPDLRTVPDAAPQGFDLRRSRRPPRKAQALQKTVDWLRKDLKAEGSALKVSDVPATREGAHEVKTRDPQARRPLRARSSGSPLIAALVGGYILHNQRMRFPWEGKPFQLQAAFSTAQAVTPGPGADGARLGRARRRHHQGRARRTATPW